MILKVVLWLVSVLIKLFFFFFNISAEGGSAESDGVVNA